MKQHSLKLTKEELDFLYSQLMMRELHFEMALKNEDDLEDVEMILGFIRRLKSLLIKVEDCRLLEDTNGTNID